MVEKLTGECGTCGTALPVRSGVGRPARYCSTGCRRAAEYELRRANRALGELEDRIRGHEASIEQDRPYVGLSCCGLVPAQREHLAIMRRQHGELTARLALLADDGKGDSDDG